MTDTGFIADAPPSRRSAAQAPLDAWLRALLAVLLAIFALGAWFAWVHTPMPEAVDKPLFEKQFSDLDRQLTELRGQGEKPISVVFLGTSRIRNVTLDAAHVTASARAVGIARPVASTVIGVNWGGFERFGPALPMIEARRPDVLVVMPELLSEDFTPLTRARMGKSWLQASLWGKDYTPFATGETTLKVCLGFDQQPADRDAEFRSFVVPDQDSRGPAMARAFLAKLAHSGTRIIVTDVPVSAELAAIRPPVVGGRGLLTQLGLADLPNAAAVVLGSRFPRQVYCDFAHMNPAHDREWQTAFFAELFRQTKIGFAY